MKVSKHPKRDVRLLGTFRSDYEYEIECEYDLSIPCRRLYQIAIYHTMSFIPRASSTGEQHWQMGTIGT